jgi:hypothetical protein
MPINSDTGMNLTTGGLIMAMQLAWAFGVILFLGWAILSWKNGQKENSCDESELLLGLENFSADQLPTVASIWDCSDADIDE